ncbi:MAG TPA: hypothetical protein PLK68_01775, partial [Thomasclavelia ramosa]|nr:hypothetical protein [Thomasclavelia ramosa]
MLKTSFFSQWLIFCLVVISLSSVAIVFIVKYTGLFWLYWFMIFSPLICAGIIFNSREIVNQTKVVIYEWRGRRMRPFLPGIYFPFRFFSFLSEGIEVPTNLLVLHIFSGSRDGLADIKKYGSPDNLLPKKGGAIRLGYDITCRIINPTKFVYSYYSEAYTQISNLVEKEVTVWVNNQEAEFVYNNFTQENWQELVIKKLASLVEEQMGVILMSFIP